MQRKVIYFLNLNQRTKQILSLSLLFFFPCLFLTGDCTIDGL